MNFVWIADGGGAESIVLLIFVLWRCFNRRWVRGDGVGLESPIQGQPFPGGILAEAISMTHTGMLYQLDISTFYLYKPLPFQIFVPWKFVKT